jgi:NAD(P)H-dependent flavin oxidoreductase YrpB (nitropropane dioxygenase family)
MAEIDMTDTSESTEKRQQSVLNIICYVAAALFLALVGYNLFAAGADIVIAQGAEAGGHGALRATLPLVPVVVDAVAPFDALVQLERPDILGIVGRKALA